MLIKFIFSNIHFTIYIFSAFVFFTIGWLYIDSSRVERNKKNLIIRSVGFFLLALSFAAYATSLNTRFFLLATQWSEILGLLIILITLVKEPVLHIPYNKKVLAFFPVSIISSFFSLIPIAVILYLLIALTYIRKIVKSYEKQLKPVFLAFLFLTIGKALSIGFLWRDTTNVFLSNFLSDFGFLWVITHLVNIIGLIILAKWTWGYIRFRLASQLFISTVSASLLIFLVTTILFTFLLLRNVEQDSLSHLKTDVRVLQYALERLQKEVISDVQSISRDTAFLNSFESENKKELFKITSNYLVSQNTSFLTVTNKDGTVLMRGEDEEKIGDNLWSDSVIKSALSGQKLSTVIARPGIFLPIVEIKAAAPVLINDKVEGAVMTGFLVDNAFVDGVKNITGLDITIFADKRRVATTFFLPDGKSRAVGTIESNSLIISRVLGKGEIFIGSSQVLNQPYYTAYAPLKTNEDKIVGMLFVGKQQSELVKAANRSLELTFLGSVILMIMSIIPAYFISRYICSQITA